MHELRIPYCSLPQNVNAAKQTMLTANDYALAAQPWSRYVTDADVHFSITHSETAVSILFRVKEKHIRHVNAKINGPVWEDSCVEFFIALDEKGYYNCEFNCIGTALVAYGTDRNNRKLLPAAVVRSIVCDVSMKRENNNYVWELLLQIPVTVFTEHTVTSLSNRTVKVNFYKCGDLLPEPHFICWNKIESTEPDFHRPDFFSPAVFEAATSITAFKETVHG